MAYAVGTVKNMSIINVPPTKTKQLEMKRDLAMATEGYTLLEQKREILVMELMNLLGRAKELQKNVDDAREKAYRSLRRAICTNGMHELRCTATAIQYEHLIRLKQRVAAGVRVPEFEFDHAEMRPQYGFIGTDSLTDATMADFLALLEAIGKLAELEAEVCLLARELKKTQRHVNALEHIFIPNYRDTLNYIGQALESKELESFFTMKKVKKNMGGNAEN